MPSRSSTRLAVTARESLGLTVRSLRERTGWTQTQMARLTGVTLRSIQRLEAGDSASQELVRAVSDVFESVWHLGSQLDLERVQIDEVHALRLPILRSGAECREHIFLLSDPGKDDAPALRNDEPASEREAAAIADFFARIEASSRPGRKRPRLQSERVLEGFEWKTRMQTLGELGFGVFGHVVMRHEGSRRRARPLVEIRRLDNPRLVRRGANPAIPILVEKSIYEPSSE